MENSGNKYDLLDILSMISFAIGVANYQENIGQSQLQKIVNDALTEIHGHLEKQDENIKRIMEILENAYK